MREREREREREEGNGQTKLIEDQKHCQSNLSFLIFNSVYSSHVQNIIRYLLRN